MSELLPEDHDPVLDNLTEVYQATDDVDTLLTIMEAILYIQWLKANLNTDHRYYYDKETW